MQRLENTGEITDIATPRRRRRPPAAGALPEGDVAKPIAPETGADTPLVDEAGIGQPNTADLQPVDSGAVDPDQVGPVPPDPGLNDSVTGDPDPTDVASVEPPPNDAIPTDLGLTEPAPAETGPTESTPPDPMFIQSTTSEGPSDALGAPQAILTESDETPPVSFAMPNVVADVASGDPMAPAETEVRPRAPRIRTRRVARPESLPTPAELPEALDLVDVSPTVADGVAAGDVSVPVRPVVAAPLTDDDAEP